MTTSNHVLLVADDLMLTSDVSGYATMQQVPFTNVRADELLSWLQNSGEDHRVLLLIDLSTPNLNAPILTEAAQHDCVVQVIGYGPHVKTDLFDAARDAGLQNLMSRGQFTAQAGGLIADFCRDASA